MPESSRTSLENLSSPPLTSMRFCANKRMNPLDEKNKKKIKKWNSVLSWVGVEFCHRLLGVAWFSMGENTGIVFMSVRSLPRVAVLCLPRHLSSSVQVTPGQARGAVCPPCWPAVSPCSCTKQWLGWQRQERGFGDGAVASQPDGGTWRRDAG